MRETHMLTERFWQSVWTGHLILTVRAQSRPYSSWLCRETSPNIPLVWLLKCELNEQEWEFSIGRMWMFLAPSLRISELWMSIHDYFRLIFLPYIYQQREWYSCKNMDSDTVIINQLSNIFKDPLHQEKKSTFAFIYRNQKGIGECLDHCFIDVRRHHDQSNVDTKAFNWMLACGVRGLVHDHLSG